MVVPSGSQAAGRCPMNMPGRPPVAAGEITKTSNLVTLGALLGTIPARIFFLKFFEEAELELRLGEDEKQYKQKVPFLIPRVSAE